MKRKWPHFRTGKKPHRPITRSGSLKKASGGKPRVPLFRIPEGFREIAEADAQFSFRCGRAYLDQFSLADYIRFAGLPNSYVIVHDVNGRPGGVAQIIIERDAVVIEKLARDEQHGPGSGGLLIKAVEKIARQLGKTELRLEAMDAQLEARYRDRYGFERSGEPYVDPECGPLIPMRKRLA